MKFPCSLGLVSGAFAVGSRKLCLLFICWHLQSFQTALFLNDYHKPFKKQLIHLHSKEVYLSKKDVLVMFRLQPCFLLVHKNLFHKPPHPSQVGKLLEGEIDELPDLTKAGREIWVVNSSTKFRWILRWKEDGGGYILWRWWWNHQRIKKLSCLFIGYIGLLLQMAPWFWPAKILKRLKNAGWMSSPLCFEFGRYKYTFRRSQTGTRDFREVLQISLRFPMRKKHHVVSKFWNFEAGKPLYRRFPFETMTIPGYLKIQGVGGPRLSKLTFFRRKKDHETKIPDTVSIRPDEVRVIYWCFRK